MALERSKYSEQKRGNHSNSRTFSAFRIYSEEINNKLQLK